MRIGWLFLLLMSTLLQAQDLRPIKALHRPQRADVGGLVTYRAFPTQALPMGSLDPFIFLNDHGPQTYGPNNNGLPFGPHPHKGFETVTFILKGDLVHADNRGHVSKITSGGVQWMIAGKGIIHSELSSEEFKQTGGEVSILQLWVNLPARLKEAEPKYTGLPKEQIPVITQDNGKTSIHLVAGKLGQHEGAYQSLTGVMMSYVYMDASATFSTSIPSDREIFCYLVEGTLKVNGQVVEGKTLLQFEAQGGNVQLEASTDAVLLFGHAPRNNEPIAAQGPFVMNTEEELRRAYQEYQQGKFGPALK